MAQIATQWRSCLPLSPKGHQETAAATVKYVHGQLGRVANSSDCIDLFDRKSQKSLSRYCFRFLSFSGVNLRAKTVS